MTKPLHEVEREHIENILIYSNYEKKKADISRPTLDRRIRDYGLE